MIASTLPLAVLLCLGSAAVAAAARSDWAPADQSQLRLLIAGAASGRLSGGVEILLEPGWHTYWRNPGEAGVPPVFDFSGSDNVADVEILFPAPERYDDGASVSLIYRDEVVFPLSVTPEEPGAPVTLRVAASFGVCKEVCIPTRTSSAVTWDGPGEADPLAAARLERYLTRLPGPPEPGRFQVEEVRLTDDSLVIDVRMPDSSYSDLFADPPSGWLIGQPILVSREDGVSHYRLPLSGRPDGARIEGQTFRFVAVAGGDAIEEAVTIGAPAPAIR